MKNLEYTQQVAMVLKINGVTGIYYLNKYCKQHDKAVS